ncbi:hypothetical protein JCM3775_001375 [Rhodotorula graminis]
MSAFAVQLDRLLLDLRAAIPSPSTSSSSQLAHVHHTLIRLERAYLELKRAGSHAPAILFLRLRNRIDELAQALDDAHSATPDLASWDKLARDTAQVAASVDDLLAVSSHATSTPSSSSHSRTPSADLPRRLPASARPSSSQTLSDLDTFLSSTAAARVPSAIDLSHLAAARARALSELYTLFQLSTSPNSVLPPGQSIRNIFRSSIPSPSHTTDHTASLESRISSQLHRAYFDSFASTLSSASPSPATAAEQSAAWARLAQDLVDAVVPLVPSRLKGADGAPLRAHLVALLGRVPGRDAEERAERDEAPTGPSSAAFDVRTVLQGVREAVRALSRLCAPARDADVRALADSIDAALDESTAADRGAALVDAVRRTLELARAMERDLGRFRAGAVTELASEEELVGVVREEGGARERALVGGWFEGEDAVRRETSAWCARALGRGVANAGDDADEGPQSSKEDVAAALVESLFANEAVALPSFSPSPSASSRPDSPASTPSHNVLPPILLAVSPACFALQNRLQALTILACLLALSPSADPARIWALLEGEFTPSAEPAPSTAGEPAHAADPAPTRLANLADELLRPLTAQPSSRPSSPSATTAPTPAPDADEAARIRSSVDRLLRADDPVWRLLHGRLRAAVRDAVVRAVRTSERDDGARAERVPGVLRTGRDARGTAPGETRPVRARPRQAPVELAPVKGFEAPFVRDELRATVQDRLVGEVWDWVEEVWGGALGWSADKPAQLSTGRT